MATKKPSADTFVLSRRPGLVQTARNGAQRVDPDGEFEGKSKNLVPHQYTTETLVTGPNAVSLAAARDARDFGARDLLVGEPALVEMRMDCAEICETAQSIPGLRLAADLIDDPKCISLINARIEQLKRG